jgi:hypothetical protein
MTTWCGVGTLAFAVPPNVQAEPAVRAATAGCHLLLDKPVAFTTEAAERIVEAVGRPGVGSLVFFTSKFTANQADWLVDVKQQPAWSSGHVRMYASIFESGNPWARRGSVRRKRWCRWCGWLPSPRHRGRR